MKPYFIKVGYFLIFIFAILNFLGLKQTEFEIRQVDDVMTLYMAFTIYAAYKAGMAVQAKRQKQTEEKIATTSDKQKGE